MHIIWILSPFKQKLKAKIVTFECVSFLKKTLKIGTQNLFRKSSLEAFLDLLRKISS